MCTQPVNKRSLLPVRQAEPVPVSVSRQCSSSKVLFRLVFLNHALLRLRENHLSSHSFFFLSLFSRPAPGLVPALVPTLPTETTHLGTTRTTEGATGATTAATDARSTIEAGTVATTSVVITRTEGEVEDTTTSPTGRVVVVAAAVVAVAAAVVEAGTIVTMTKITTALEGGAHAPARPRSDRAAVAALATLTNRHQADPGAPGTQATPHGPDPHLAAVIPKANKGARK